MPRRSHFPAYPSKMHASGQARIVWKGKHYYLGKHGSPESKKEYARLVAELAETAELPKPKGKAVTIADVVLRWQADADARRGPGNREVKEIGRALLVLNRLHRDTLARDFGPVQLEQVRTAMVSGSWMTPEERAKRQRQKMPVGWCRSQTNHMVTRIRTVFRWAERQGLVPPGTWHHLRSLESLGGRDRVRTTARRQPATREALDAVVRIVPPQVAAMLELQWLTGMRPGEVCKMRALEVDRQGPSGTWLYRLETDKNSWREDGPPPPVVLGPECQRILLPWLEAARKPEDHVFPPSRRRVQQHYTEFSYAQVVRRACDAAGIPRFSPYCLRHAAKQRIEREHGEEAARQVLRQKSLESTRHYARKVDTARAAEIMGEAG